MACTDYENCKQRLLPDDPMIPVHYPNGQYKTLCQDCGADTSEPLQSTRTPLNEVSPINGYQQVKAQLNYLQNKLNDHLDFAKNKNSEKL